jgi:hypothetical protein
MASIPTMTRVLIILG